MGIRLKTLITIFCLIGVYAFYYFALPKLINLMKADGNTDLITDMGRTKSYL